MIISFKCQQNLYLCLIYAFVKDLLFVNVDADEEENVVDGGGGGDDGDDGVDDGSITGCV